MRGLRAPGGHQVGGPQGRAGGGIEGRREGCAGGGAPAGVGGRRRPEGAREVGAQVRLVVVADGGGDLGERAARVGGDQVRGEVDPVPLEDPLGADADPLGELGPDAGVTDLADLVGTTPRSLQRLFAGWVGVSPKWVLQRHRVHLAADLLAADPALPLADVAADVGYYDQAHLGVDFARALGTTPAAYARRCAASRAALEPAADATPGAADLVAAGRA